MPDPDDNPDLSGVSFTRSADYRTIYSNLIRTRLGPGEVVMVISRMTHSPSRTAEVNTIEEQVEIIVGWPQLKMLSSVLASLVTAIEEEVGAIPVPIPFQHAAESQPEMQRAAVRSLGLSAKPLGSEDPPVVAPGVTEPTKPRTRSRGKGK
jgi:hypothetical protein